jgi:branched-chain amino acid transport system ATP-binding protein
MALLEVENVHTFYSKIHALKGISLNVEEAEIVTLIGANGAGKSTTLNTISGLLRNSEGSIRLDGDDLSKYPPHEIAAKGIVQVPEGRRIFGQLTVIENLEMGAFTQNNSRKKKEVMDYVFKLFPRCKERRNQIAGTLSGGEQQMLAIGRALMAEPRVLLLDEPSMGLAPVLVENIFDTIEELNQEGITILLVEQNARMALLKAHRGYVMQTGEIVLSGTAEELRNNAMVRKAYLGIA